MSRPRPIHTIHRDIQDAPDAAEPSFSYERQSFLATQEEATEDEFHRRLTFQMPTPNNVRRSDNNSSNGSSTSALNEGDGGVGSFWRSRGTSHSSAALSRGSSKGSKSSRAREISPSITSKKQPASSSYSSPLNNNSSRTEKGLSGGGIGAALLLQSSSSTPETNHHFSLSEEEPSSNKNSPPPVDHDPTRRSSPSFSQSSNYESKKKDATKQRAEARRLKYKSQMQEVDVGHEVVPEMEEDEKDNDYFGDDDNNHEAVEEDRSVNAASIIAEISVGGNNRRDISIGTIDTTVSGGMSSQASISVPSDIDYSPTIQQGSNHGMVGSNNRSSSSSTVGGAVLFGKSSSLIFPTGVKAPLDVQDEAYNYKRHKINLLLDACDSVRFPFKKKLILSSLNLTAANVPVKDLYNTSLGNSLHKLSLAGNRLSTIPPKLVTCLPVLKTLDLSQCELHQVPERWNLPQLKHLNLSHNRLTDFPEEMMLEGLLELQELSMYGNKVSDIIVPQNPKLLAKLEILNLGYNDLSYLPEDLDNLKALRTLKVMHNLLEKIPMRVCDMELKNIDVSSNPVIQPPIETCERGIGSMKRYYHCLRMEDKSKAKLQAVQQSRASSGRQAKKPSKTKIGFGIGSITKSIRASGSSSLGRKTSDESSTTKSYDSAAPGTNIDSLRRSKSVGVPGLPTIVQTQHSGWDGGLMPARRSLSLDQEAPTVVQTQHSGWDGLDQEAMKKKTAAASPKYEIHPAEPPPLEIQDEITVNDTLKVIFVGMAMVGKTSMIKRLIEGEGAIIPKRDDRTVGVDIYEWDPKIDRRYEHIDTRIELCDEDLQKQTGDVNVKFSVWDFAGQHVYHATHQLFFSYRALYVLVWDMGATNSATRQRKTDHETNKGAFSLNYDSDDESEEEDNGDFSAEEEARRADRALERDIDEKVQFWVDCIQSSAPGAAILPVASFDDYFESDGGQEANRRCNILKHRLLKHEDRRIQGIKDRLKEYCDNNRAHDEGAQRLRKLLSSYTRPKLIFGNDEENSVIRVSGTKYTGFADLTQRVIDIATGRDKCNMSFPIFRGHVGVRIPRMRLEVREAVRRMRDRFKVVEWGYFLNQLRESGLTNVDDISDALHFLANIGELSYFGLVLPDRDDNGMEESDVSTIGLLPQDHHLSLSYADTLLHNQAFGRRTSYKPIPVLSDNPFFSDDDLDDDDLDDDDEAFLCVDDTTLTSPMAPTEDTSMTASGESIDGGLSQFVFLNPRWLVAAVACILRHDLDREIHETRRSLNTGIKRVIRGDSFYEANLNCPVITADDACMLWQAKKFTKKAAERALEFSSNMAVKPFEFLQLLLIRFGVFVPIDLGIDKAFLGGREYSFSGRSPGDDAAPDEITVDQPNTDLKATYFFLPSLLGPGEPAEAWTYKSTDSWKATLCHSVLFPDGVPPGLMERITATVLSNMYSIAHKSRAQGIAAAMPISEGRLAVKEVLCWRTAFLVKLGLQTISATSDGTDRVGESVVEVFCGLVDKDSHLCVGSEYMSVGSRRLVTSAKGQEGNGGRKIWNGGYLLVVKAVQRVMEEYGGLEFERQGFCPDCLAKKAIHEASSWDLTMVRAAVKKGEGTIRCRHGHRIDTRLVAGPVDIPTIPRPPTTALEMGSDNDLVVPINELLRAVVVVALWDGKTRKVIRCGSGFIADKKRGLIVTASHTLMNIWGDKSTPFGEHYYGLRHGKVLIGVVPRHKSEDSGTEAVFRYFAKIVSKDPNIDQGVCHLDACVLRITTRMEKDVAADVEECAEQPERLLLNNPYALKQERLHQLRITNRCELDEQVRIVGYNQGGEGVFGPGATLNRYVDFARGYVCKKFAGGEGNDGLRHRFKPREEIVVICPTIGGHSGGPCVNQQGEVIGILSRADPAESQRCYLVPTYEWRALLKEAKNTL
jgi:GTPase SAR1 family protein/Leucine-rich repeat (LRR) protein